MNCRFYLDNINPNKVNREYTLIYANKNIRVHSCSLAVKKFLLSFAAQWPIAPELQPL
jgi:hypothetical protein